MNSNSTSKLWQANSKNFNQQNQDDIEWEISILENRKLLMARLEIKDPFDITDVASYYGICNVIRFDNIMQH